MKRIVLLLTTLFAVSLVFAVAAFGYNAYESLNWVEAKGTFLHAVTERETGMSAFVKYREVVTADSTKKPAHFTCMNEGIQMQVLVAEIRSIKLAIAPKEISRKIHSDKYKKLILTMRDGRQFKVEVEYNMGVSLVNHEYIEFKYFNPISNKFEYGGVLGDKLREIRFD